MNKLIVVTGGTKGIGKAILEKFAGQQFDLVTCSRNQKDLDELQNNFNQKYPDISFQSLKADLSQKQQAQDFVEYIRKMDRDVDVLVNNAGIFIPGAIHQEEEGKLEQMINTNLYSAYHIIRGLIEPMKSRKQGHIFNMCSTASIIPYVNGGSYCISKFALLGLSKVLREEMKNFNVKVTAILPGATLTASWEGVDLPPERFMKSEDVAESVYTAYSLSERSVVEEILIRPQLGDL